MKKKLLKKFKKIVPKQYFKIEEEGDKLIFYLKNKIPTSKNYLIFKHADTGKRISKEIKSSKAKISIQEIEDIGEIGIYDIYLKTSILNKKTFLQRINFTLDNDGMVLFDEINQKILESFQTKHFNLSFNYKNSIFIAKAINLEKNDNYLTLNGEIELCEDDVKFDTVEILIPLENYRKYIPCEYKRNGNIINFKVDLNFKISEEDINGRYPISIRIKDGDIIIDKSRIKSNNLYKSKKIEDKYLDYIENFEGENEYSEICSLCYVDNYSNLRFNIINKNNIKKLINNEKKLRKYYTERKTKKIAFFESFHGQSYSGQPKYIYEKLLELGYDKYIDFIWSYEGNLDIPGNPLITNRNSTHYKSLLRDSDYWITNISFPILKENKKTIYIQTTHGTPYKHMGSDIQTNSKNIPKGRVLLESNTWNYLLSPNDFAENIFKRAFEYNGTVINKGYPANDIFYQNSDKKIAKIKKELNIDDGKKVILYAPTFRDYDVDSNKQRQFKIFLDLKKLYENLGDEYILIVRLHYLLSKNLKLDDELKDFIMDLSNYDDIADLYLISDILISDYSSVFFDYAHSKKPILFFVPDYEKYNEFRGLYSEVKETLPGPEIYNNDDLIKSIKNIEEVSKEYREKYSVFYNKFCKLGHGTSGEEVVNIVFGDVKNG